MVHRGKSLLSTLIPLILCAFLTAGCNRRIEHPNLLLITIDTLRADHLGCYGYQGIKTPNIDALADRGVLFETAISPVPLTLPSHTTIMTGRYPSEHGVRDNGFYSLPEGYPTLALELKKAGYSTAAVVSSSTLDSRYGLAAGFDLYDDPYVAAPSILNPNAAERSARETAEIVLKWLNGHPSEPFFLWVHFFDPHAPYKPPEYFAKLYPGRPYDGEIAFVDGELKKIMDVVEAGGLDKRAIVILTADHGESLGEHQEDSHGIFLYDSTLHVPLIAAGPGLPRGVRRGALAPLVELAPWIRYLTGIAGQEDAPWLQKIVTGDATGRKAVFIETEAPLNLMGWSPLSGIRTYRRKYIEAPEEELYDLTIDPRERRNIIDEKPKLAARMKRSMEETREHFAPPPQKGPHAPDAAERERLKSLGYVGEPIRTGAVRKDPKDMVLMLRVYNQALTAKNNGDMAGGIDILEKGLRRDPDNPRLLHELAFLRHRAGKLEEARETYEKLLSIDPRLVTAWSDLGSVYASLKMYPQAIKACRKALAIDPDFTDALYSLGAVYQIIGDFARAERFYRKAIESHPKHYLSNKELGKLLYRNPETRSEALQLLKTDILVRSQSSTIYA